MNPNSILLPLAAQLVLIMLTAILTVSRRRRGALDGDIKMSKFKGMNLHGIDNKYLTPGNSFNNQFQLPMLFIMFILFALQLQLVDGLFIFACWVFVALRYVHAAIHLSYNNVIHRLLAFTAGAIVLFASWARLLWLAQ